VRSGKNRTEVVGYMHHVIALGFFDGVHMGHAALMKRTRQLAEHLGVPSMALTFDRHPDEIVKEIQVPLLNTTDERREIIKKRFAIDEVRFAVFDREMMTTPWERYVEDTLISELGAIHLVVGHDHRFGYMGEGTAEKLQKLCKSRGIGCDIIPKVELNGVTVSSTYIRSLIAEGDAERAAQYLGYRHFITGEAIPGRGIGSKALYATANIAMPKALVSPAFGVYATRVLVDGAVYDAVTNIGRNPTVGETPSVSVESHLLGFSGDLYGKTLRVFFYKYLRKEQKFPNVTALKAQIAEDIKNAQAFLSAAPPPEIV